MLSLSDKGGGCSPKVAARWRLECGPLPLYVFLRFMPREIGMGLEIDEGLVVKEEPEPEQEPEPD